MRPHTQKARATILRAPMILADRDYPRIGGVLNIDVTVKHHKKTRILPSLLAFNKQQTTQSNSLQGVYSLIRRVCLLKHPNRVFGASYNCSRSNLNGQTRHCETQSSSIVDLIDLDIIPGLVYIYTIQKIEKCRPSATQTREPRQPTLTPRKTSKNPLLKRRLKTSSHSSTRPRFV